MNLMRRYYLYTAAMFAPPDDGKGGAGDDDGKGGDAGAGDEGGDGEAGKKKEAAPQPKGGAFKKAAKEEDDAGGDDGGDKDDDKDGADGRPDGIPDKFWDKDKKAVRTDEMAKAYSTLEAAHAKLKKEKGYPADTSENAADYLAEGIVLPEGTKLDRIRELDAKNDPAVNVFRALAAKHKIPKSVAAALASDFLIELNPLLPEPVTEEQIVKELGKGGASMRDALGTWMEGKYNAGDWSADELDWAYDHFGTSVTGMRLLNKMRSDAGEKPIPMGAPDGTDLPSKEEWYAMNRDPKYVSDPAFRAKVDRLGEQIFGDDPTGSSEAGLGVAQSGGFDRKERQSTRT